MPDFGINFSDPATQRTLAYYLAGMGSTIAGNQGVGGFLGATTQDLIRAQNLRNLIQTLSGQPTQPTQPTQAGQAGTTPTTKAGTNKISFEGTNLDDIAKLLSGMTVSGAGNFVLPR